MFFFWKKKKNAILKESLRGIQYEKAYNIKDNSWVSAGEERKAFQLQWDL